MWDVFLEDFQADAAAFKSINLHWVPDCSLKPQNEEYCNDSTIHTANPFFYMKFRLWDRLRRFISVNPLPIALKKSQFSLPVMIFFKKKSFLLKEDLSILIWNIPYSHNEYEESKCPACSLFLFQVATNCAL